MSNGIKDVFYLFQPILPIKIDIFLKGAVAN
jgi:hypothetical protein